MKLKLSQNTAKKVAVEIAPQKKQAEGKATQNSSSSTSKIADTQLRSQTARFLLERSMSLTQSGNSSLPINNPMANIIAGGLQKGVQVLRQTTQNQQEAETRADEILADYGGEDNISQEDAVNIGGDIAEIAETDPALAIEVMNIVQEKLSDTDETDNVASGFTDSLTNEQLLAVANTEGGREMLTNLVGKLMNTDTVYYEEEEEILKIVQALVLSGNLRPGTFTTLDGIAAADAYLTAPGTEVPELTAQAIQEEEDPQRANQMYLEALESHNDDPEWLNRFYKTLGTNKTAELLSNVANSPFTTEEQLQTIGQSFVTLANAGLLNQTDIDVLAVTVTGNSSFNIPQFFSELMSALPDAPGSVQVKNMFADAMARISTGQLPTALDPSENIGGVIKASFAAYATQILATTSESNQIEQLNRLRNTLGEAGFNTFISSAMISEDSSEEVIESLLSSVVNTGDAELQKAFFNAVNQGLSNPSVLERFGDNIEFKDNLSTIFINNRDSLLADAQRNSEGEDSGVFTDSFERGLEAFFQITLLTSPPGKEYENLAGSIYELINKGVTALDNDALANRDQAAFDSFVSEFGMEPTVYAQLLGGVLGCLTDATGFSQEAINADQAQKEATIKFFTGLAVALIPGAGGIIAGQVGNQIFKHFTENAADYLQDQVIEQIEENVNTLLTSSFKNGDEKTTAQFYSAALSIFNSSLRELPNGQSVEGDSTQEQFDFQSEFFDGFQDTTQYTRYDDAVND